MSADVNAYQYALVRCEQEISAIDAQIAKLSSDRRTLMNTRAALLCQLGRSAPLDAAPSDFNSLEEDNTPVTVPRNAFRNMRISDAARKYLLMVGRPVTHPELVNALERGKATTGGHHAREHIRTALKRRADWFVWTPNGKRGLWTLVEWPRPIVPAEASAHDEIPELTKLTIVGQPETHTQAPA